VDRNQWHDPQHCVIRLYDAETCRELRQFQGHTATIDSSDFSPDSRLLVSGSGAQDLNKREKGSHDSSIRVWDVESGRELIEEQLQKPLKCVRFSPDGKRIATGA
jgi:WD40 repeat protein